MAAQRQRANLGKNGGCARAHARCCKTKRGASSARSSLLSPHSIRWFVRDSAAKGTALLGGARSYWLQPVASSPWARCCPTTPSRQIISQGKRKRRTYFILVQKIIIPDNLRFSCNSNGLFLFLSCIWVTTPFYLSPEQTCSICHTQVFLCASITPKCILAMPCLITASSQNAFWILSNQAYCICSSFSY